MQEAAQRVLAVGLGADDSVVTPGVPVWSLETAEELVAAFVDRPDAGTGTFLVKLREQLAGVSPRALQLAAELQYLTLLPLADRTPDAKRQRVREVLRWADVEELPDHLDEALEAGVFNGGLGFTVQGWKQFALLISFVRHWKSLPTARREVALRDPWQFRDVVQEVPGPKPAAQRFALAYLAFPDVFEPIVNADHRKAIVATFLPEVGQTAGDVDRDLLAVRAALEARAAGEPVDFYRAPYVERWQPRTPAIEPDHPTAARRAWLVRGSSVQGIDLVPKWLDEGWVSLAATHLPPVSADLERDALKALVDTHYGTASYSQRRQKVDEFHALLTLMQPGDIVVTTHQGDFYLGEVTGPPAYDPEDKRARLRRPVRWDDRTRASTSRT